MTCPPRLASARHLAQQGSSGWWSAGLCRCCFGPSARPLNPLNAMTRDSTFFMFVGRQMSGQTQDRGKEAGTRAVYPVRAYIINTLPRAYSITSTTSACYSLCYDAALCRFNYFPALYRYPARPLYSLSTTLPIPCCSSLSQSVPCPSAHLSVP